MHRRYLSEHAPGRALSTHQAVFQIDINMAKKNTVNLDEAWESVLVRFGAYHLCGAKVFYLPMPSYVLLCILQLCSVPIIRKKENRQYIY